MAVLNSASLLVSQPRIGRPPHLVTRRGLYPISRPIGRLFPHLASSDRQCNAPHRSPLPDHRDARSWPGWSFHRRRTCGEVHVPLDDCARAVVQTCDQVGRGPAGGRAPERSLRGQAAAPRAMPSRMTTRTLAVGGIDSASPRECYRHIWSVGPDQPDSGAVESEHRQTGSIDPNQPLRNSSFPTPAHPTERAFPRPSRF